MAASFLKQPSFLVSFSQLKTLILKHAYALYLFFIPLIFSVPLHNLSSENQKTIALLHTYATHHAFAIAATFVSLSAITAIVITLIHLSRPKKVYLVDFACYNHDPIHSVSREKYLEKMSSSISSESIAFMGRVMEKSGVSDNTFLYGVGAKDFPPECTFSAGRAESETVIFGALEDLFAKTGVNPRDIGVVIVNNSAFNPVPSLSAMIVNKYKLGRDVLSYNLGGMGCSATIIALDLAKTLLQVRRNTRALIVSLECPTTSYYAGEDRSKLLSICLFRMGGAAVLLSNRSSDRRISKYELKHTLRTHMGSDDAAYNCVVQEVDDIGKVGFTLSKKLMTVAGEALRANITALGPSVLPISQQLMFLATLIARKVFKMKGVKPFVPDFKLAFEHFCIHAGGKGVLDEVEKNLKLTKWHMEPSRMTLHRYSNTSSSSVWYELAYAEAKGRIRKGDRVWQIGFGSGFKCGSAVWTALRTVNPDQHYNPWTNIIHHFPVSS